MSSCQRPTRAKMWLGGRDLSVAASGGNTELRELWLVVGVDQVVRDSGMVGFGGEKFFENCGGCFSVGESFVVVRFRSQERERVEHSGFVIVWVGFVDLLHGVGIDFGTRSVVQLRATIESCGGGDVRVLAGCGFRGQLFCGVNLVQSAGDYFLVGFVPELMPDAHGDAPVRHRTFRVILGNVNEFLLGFFVPERMQQGDSAGEGLLHRRGTGDGEMYGAELRLGEVFVVVMVFIVIVVGEGGEREQRGEYEQ
jgi:hypothetical protein